MSRRSGPGHRSAQTDVFAALRSHPSIRPHLQMDLGLTVKMEDGELIFSVRPAHSPSCFASPLSRKALRDVTPPYSIPIQVRAVHAACPMLYNSTSLSRGFPL
jgi:hypothetical protein